MTVAAYLHPMRGPAFLFHLHATSDYDLVALAFSCCYKQPDVLHYLLMASEEA